MNRSILHVIASLEGGGAERQLAMLASEQARRGHRVAIALRRRGPNDRGDVEIIELGDRAGASAMLLLRLARIVGDFDVVQTWLPQMDVHGGIAALARRIPWVMTERSIALAYPESAANRTRKWLARRATAIVANSQLGSEMWPGSSVIHNAVPPQQPVGQSARASGNSLASTSGKTGTTDAELELGRPEPVFVFAGRLVEAKGPQHVVAAAALAGARVIIFGDGPLRDRLRADIARLGANVTLAGYRDDWTKALVEGTVVVSPSAIEGEPNVILEAMATGCPIIASDIPAHRALLDDDSLVPIDAHAIAEKMREHSASTRALTSRTYALADRSIERVADRYDAVYASIG